MLNHWGIGGVLVFNLVENADLRQPPRKKEEIIENTIFPTLVKASSTLADYSSGGHDYSVI